MDMSPKNCDTICTGWISWWIISLKQIWDKSSATVSWRKRKTHVCFDVVICAACHQLTILPTSFWVASLMETGHLRELRLPHPIWRGERNLYTQCYATHRSHNFTENHDTGTYTTNFPDKRLTSFETCVGWFMLYFDMHFRLFLEWCYGFMIMYLWYLNIQVPKHFGLQFPSVRNARRPQFFLWGFRDEIPVFFWGSLYDTQASMWAPHGLFFLNTCSQQLCCWTSGWYLFRHLVSLEGRLAVFLCLTFVQ